MCLGVPGRVLDLDDSGPLLSGRVDFGGIIKQICLEPLPEARPGDWVIVHAGMALARLDADAAARALEALAELEPG